MPEAKKVTNEDVQRIYADLKSLRNHIKLEYLNKQFRERNEKVDSTLLDTLTFATSSLLLMIESGQPTQNTKEAESFWLVRSFFTEMFKERKSM